MSLMARFAKFDSALQRGLDNGFAFIFGGRVVPAEIEELLKQETEDNLTTIDGVPEAPNVFEVGVSGADLEQIMADSPDLPASFADRLGRFCRNQGWSLAGPVRVIIAEESGLRTGQLRASSYSDAQPEAASNFDVIPSSPDPDGHPGLSDPESGAMHPHNPSAQQARHASPGVAGAAAASSWGSPNSPAPYFDSETDGRTRERPAAAVPEPGEDAQAPAVSLLLQDGSSRTYLIHQGSNIIGRANDAAFRLPDTGVSRQHAEITWDGQDAVLADLQSTNGTSVNDTPVDNWLLADGDIITIGHSHIEVRIIWPGQSAQN